MSGSGDRKTRIAMVTHSYFPHIGGVEKHVRKLSENLIKEMEVEIFTIDHALSQAFTRETLNGIFVNRFKSRRITYGIEMPPSLLLDKLLEFNPDIIHLHNLHTLLPMTVLKAAEKSRCQVVITPHYHGQSENAFRNQLLKVYHRSLSKVVSVADKIICVSEFEKSLMLRDFNLDDKRIVVIPNAIDFDQAAPNQQKDMSRLLFVGRLEKYKNVDKIVQSLLLLPPEKLFKLTIVGDGPELGSISKLITNLGLAGAVAIRKNLTDDQLAAEYKSSGVLIHPSHFEAYGIVVAEALNFGMRVIVANTSSLTDFVKAGFALGITLPVTAEKIAEAVNHCVRSSLPIKQYPHLGWHTVAEKTKAEYNEVLSS